MDRVRRSFSVRSETKRTEAKFFSLRSETEGFVSLVSFWSETVDFTYKTKRKWSETKRKWQNKTKRKKQSERNNTKISTQKMFWSETKGKQPLIFLGFEAKQKIRKRNKAKRKIRKRKKAKRKTWKQNEAKRKIRKQKMKRKKMRKRNEAKR